MYVDNKCILGQARLSIIDLAGGSQPMTNEDGTLWITYNGEVYNYIELREELLRLGHEFKTDSDTEVILHAFEEWDKGCLSRFNGQFAFAIYDSKSGRFFMARDRMGIRPLYWTLFNDRLYFGSEIKAIFCEPAIPRKLDYKGLDETFTWWTSAPPRTLFEKIYELEAGCWVEFENGEIKQGRYWSMSFPLEFNYNRSIESYAEELKELLIDSVRLRLRSDVPVGAYLSGGLDSSVTTALVRYQSQSRLETFSVTFEDKAFDESSYQAQMVNHLGTSHHTVHADYTNIAESFYDVIFHTERPIVRTAPTPLYLLSGLVRQNNFKVVLTGEGSDEILAGYDLFKETLIRRFWARQPDSKWRSSLLKRLYPTLPVSGNKAFLFLEQFYKTGLNEFDKYHYSHMPRINTVSQIKTMFAADVRECTKDHDAIASYSKNLPDDFSEWHHLSKAQWLEARSLLAGYLLSSQGDRVLAANSIEGRFPFLDHRLVEFASTIPPGYKMRGLNEKFVLKKAMQADIPDNIIKRVKQPYMAPDSNCFVQDDSPEYVNEMFSSEMVSRAGIFNEKSLERLVQKCRRLSGTHLSFRDNMAFVGALSTQLLWYHFIDNFQMPEPIEKDKFSVYVDKTV
jgi:asparagine synthase (glutamine-hydrolysing)